MGSSNPQLTETKFAADLTLEEEPQMMTIQLLRVTDRGDEPVGELIVELIDPALPTSAKVKGVIVPNGTTNPGNWVQLSKLRLPVPPPVSGKPEGPTVTLTMRGPGGTPDTGDGMVHPFPLKPVAVEARSQE